MKKNIYSGSSRIQRVESSPIRVILDKAADLRAEGYRVIPLSAGEPNFSTPLSIKKSTIKAIEENYSHYGSNRGTPELREIISRLTENQTGVNYSFDNEIIVTSSGAEAINNVIMTFIEDGDEVILFTPAFVSYKNLINYCGGKLVDIPLSVETDFQLDIEKLKNSITPATKMIIINNPNNPTGSVYSRESLEMLSEIAIKNDLIVVSDEMYSNLVYENKEFISISSFKGMKERSIIINGFSKTYAMTGWRIGYILGDSRLCDLIIKMHQYSTTCSPTFIQKGLIDSLELEETKAAVSKMINEFSERRKLLINGLEELKINYIKPYGAFYILLDVSKIGFTGEEFSNRLLDEEYVATVPVAGMGRCCENLVRLSYAASTDDIKEGIKRIGRFIEGINV